VRICLLNAAHPANDKRVYHKMAIALADAGHRVSLLSPKSGEVSDLHQGIEVAILLQRGKQRGSWIARPRILASLLRHGLRASADVYQASELDSWLVGCIIKVFRSTKIIFDMHEHYPSTMAEKVPRLVRPIANWLTRLFMRMLACRTDYILAPSVSLLQDVFGERETGLVIGNFSKRTVGEEFLAVPDERHDSTDPFVAIHVGMLTQERGMYQLLDALALMDPADRKRTRLKVVGGVFVNGKLSDTSEKEFLRQAQIRGLQDNLEIVPWIPFGEVRAHLLTSHAGLIAFLPTRVNNRFGLPHKLFDYMEAGLPVIAPAYPEIARVVEGAACGLLINPAEPQEIADALLHLVHHPEEARAMGNRGRLAVEATYNWEAEAMKLQQLYEGIAVSLSTMN
jgi:glycosyltransferase involved in cell wall biosynthesis